jgi:uncharacterized protein (TIGR00297 family)
LGLALALAGVGWAAGWLTLDGMVAAAVVGGAVFAGSGWPGGLLLALFFLSGSVLTQKNQRSEVAGLVSPGGARNARQVVANGLWAGVGAMLVNWRPDTGWAVLTGALAAAQSDTWATEFGAHSRRPPRMITTGAVVPRGTSGAVSLRGTTAGLVGAATAGALALAIGVPARAALAGVIGGSLGMVADSLLGATVQGRFVCSQCGQPSERSSHCERPARRLAGWRWLDNDGVNLLATGAGGSTAALLLSWL